MLPLRANVDFPLQSFDTEREKDTSCFLLPSLLLSDSLSLATSLQASSPFHLKHNRPFLPTRGRCLKEQHLIDSERHYQLRLSCQWITVVGLEGLLKGKPWGEQTTGCTSSLKLESQKRTSDPLAITSWTPTALHSERFPVETARRRVIVRFSQLVSLTWATLFDMQWGVCHDDMVCYWKFCVAHATVGSKQLLHPNSNT